MECFRFGPFDLDAARERLVRAGERVRIAPKPYAVLLHLLRHRDRVVARDELLELAWPGVTVSNSAFESVVRDLRRLLEDCGTQSRFIETVRGRGLRFVHPVVVTNGGDSSGEAGAAWEAAAAQLERALTALDSIRDQRGSSVATRAAEGNRADLLLAVGRARWAAGAQDASRETFLRAARIARRVDDPEILGWAALGYAGRTDLAPEVNAHAVELLEEALSHANEIPTSLRAELLARLGTELYFSSDPTRSETLTEEAMALAEASGDKSVLAYTLTAHQFVRYRPDIDPRGRLEFSARAIALMNDEKPSDVLAVALQEHLVDLLEIGDGPGFFASLRRFGEVTSALQQPFFLWMWAQFEGLAALLAEDVERAEALAQDALELGQRAATPNALPNYLAQLLAIRAVQGREGELADPLASLLRQRPGAPVVLAAVARVRAAEGDLEAAGPPLSQLVAGLDQIPHDFQWPGTLAMAAGAAAARGDLGLCDQLAAALEPYRGRMILVGYGASTHGAVDRHLGVLAGARGEAAKSAALTQSAERLEAGLRRGT